MTKRIKEIASQMPDMMTLPIDTDTASMYPFNVLTPKKTTEQKLAMNAIYGRKALFEDTIVAGRKMSHKKYPEIELSLQDVMTIIVTNGRKKYIGIPYGSFVIYEMNDMLEQLTHAIDMEYDIDMSVLYDTLKIDEAMWLDVEFVAVEEMFMTFVALLQQIAITIDMLKSACMQEPTAEEVEALHLSYLDNHKDMLEDGYDEDKENGLKHPPHVPTADSFLWSGPQAPTPR